MSSNRRLVLAAAVGLLLVAGAVASDFEVASFWERHALLTSLIANVLVVAVTVVVLNELIERRSRRRWSLLAQSALFALTQSARATWTLMLELLEIAEVESGDPESLIADARLALDTPRLSEAVYVLLAQEDGRARLQMVCQRLGQHCAQVIATWAAVMIEARPYAEILDRHVELAGRLEWLGSVLAQNEPAPDQTPRERNLTRSSIAAEYASELAEDEWLHDMTLSMVRLALRLDYESRETAFSIVSREWWTERTTGLVQDASR
jgi:hypothetical protein